MAGRGKTLFDPCVRQEKLHPIFEVLRTSPESEPTRWMLDDVYQSFHDPEGNFLEQFQTAGFNARVFELYLFAYFSRSGFAIERTMPNPDFLVERAGVRVAVEATTVNPATSGVFAKSGKKISELTDAEFREYQKHELAIRFGGPLFSKLEKRYWELGHCKDLPLVLAIEAFHDKDSLALSDWALIRYLFGVEQTGTWDEEGRLKIETASVQRHTVGEKSISSGFFGQPGAEHVSAVLFTNSGTTAKFARMGYQHGIGCDIINMIRSGICYNPDPDAMDSTFFSYNLAAPPFIEPWGQGLVVQHNPNARHPLSRDFFVDAVQGYIEDGLYKADYPAFHPFSSTTLILHFGDSGREVFTALRRSLLRVAVGAIPRDQFQGYCGFGVVDTNPILEEHGWFADDTDSVLGVIIRDKIDDDWGYVVLGRDEHFAFRAIDTQAGLRTRDQARRELQTKMAEIVSSPQRIFPQGPSNFSVPITTD